MTDKASAPKSPSSHKLKSTIRIPPSHTPLSKLPKPKPGRKEIVPRFVTANGISRQETGVGFGPAGAQQQGQWQYTAPNGQVHLKQLVKRSLHRRTQAVAQRKHDHGHGFGLGHDHSYGHLHPPRKSRPLRTGLQSVRLSGGQNVKFKAPGFNLNGPRKVKLNSGLSDFKVSGPDVKVRLGQNVRIRSGLPSFRVSAPDVNLRFGQKVNIRSGL